MPKLKSSKPILPSEITPPETWAKRRTIIKAGLAAGVGLATAGIYSAYALYSAPSHTGQGKIPNIRTTAYGKNLTPTEYRFITTYNNFYELGTDKSDPAKHAAHLRPRPWEIIVEGECHKPGRIGIDEILSLFPQEERIYRFRCVEAWAMIVPWVGFPLAKLLKRFEPTAKAKYVAFETLHDPEQLPGQKRPILPWPYREGLRMDEAMHPLTLLATGLYGEVLPNQNGAPLRLVVPWKYGFKSIKSIVKIRFQERQPRNTWQVMAPHEYGFYANVNPDVAHPRWSQKRHRLLGQGLFARKEETLPFNGYAEQVAHLYRGMDLRRYF